MTTLKVLPHREGGRYTKRQDIILYDRSAPDGFLYAWANDMDHARKIIATERAAFAACGISLVVLWA